MRVADYIAQTLVAHGIRHVFMITGGGAMHLNDAIGRCAGLEYICCHHEQACAMAAESYARLSGKMAAVNVTTGPGGINALNGVFGAYTDSIPMIVISGQVKGETCMGFYDGLNLRQLGDQEADIVRMASGVTKYAVLIKDAQSIRYHLERALHLAQSGRPGPVWVDVPVDIQGAQIEPENLKSYDPALDTEIQILRAEALEEAARGVLQRLTQAKRPAILAGHGIRMSGAHEELLELAARLQIPVCAAWDAIDLVPNHHPCYAGRPGTVGERGGNFSLQNSDVALILGCRLVLRQISYGWKNFAREAFKIQVDIDPLELDKPTVKPDWPVCADAKEFLQECLRQAAQSTPATHENYLEWCRERVRRFPVVTQEHRAPKDEGVSGYHFVEVLGAQLQSDDVVVTANGAASVMTMQALPIQKGMRVLANSGSASMGYDLPGAIGACYGRKARDGQNENASGRVICLAGDGSIMMNLQELQTISHHALPVKIFVWNNGMYLSIRTTQENFFGGNLVGEGPTSGVSAPNFLKLAQAFGLKSWHIENSQHMEKIIAEVLASPGPALCEVMMPPGELMLPKTSSLRLPDGRMVSKPLEDMFPFLSREEFEDNMIIAPLGES